MHNRDEFRKNLLKFTIKAFEKIPFIENPQILEIGCGTGVPTMELARLTNGMVTAVDTDSQALEILSGKIEKAGLRNRITITKSSMKDISLPPGTFDIIWSEGAIAQIGFKTGLAAWNLLLKPKGFCVIHDEIKSRKEKESLIPSLGFSIVDIFTISEDKWWDLYYSPMNEIIMAGKEIEDAGTIKNEIARFKKNPLAFSSIFYILRKT